VPHAEMHFDFRIPVFMKHTLGKDPGQPHAADPRLPSGQRPEVSFKV
jgi:hypothetical protein